MKKINYFSIFFLLPQWEGQRIRILLERPKRDWEGSVDNLPYKLVKNASQGF